jgi:hypothetical protein
MIATTDTIIITIAIITIAIITIGPGPNAHTYTQIPWEASSRFRFKIHGKQPADSAGKSESESFSPQDQIVDYSYTI